MSRARIRLLLAASLVLVNLLVFAGTGRAQANMVTGTLQLDTKLKPTPAAVAVITLAARSKDGAGTIIGQQRINGATGNDAFAVQFDPAIIKPNHAYAIYASLIDGTNHWFNQDGIPTIPPAGPLEGLVVPLAAAAYQTPAAITGTIALPSGTTLSSEAVAYATILNTTTGRLVSRTVIPSPTTFPVPFSVAYDAALLNPENVYVANAGVVDGATLYAAKAPTPIAPDAVFDLTVAKTNTVIPVPGASATPTAEATPTPAETPTATPAETPTATPTGLPTETPKPTKTPKETPTPTAVPTESPSPTPAPTESPSPTPSASVSPTPSPTPSASPSPSPTPTASPSGSLLPSASPSAGPITITGQAFYKEPATLTADAVLTVVVVQVKDGEVVPVGEVEMKNPGQQPISFSLTLDPTLLDPTLDAHLWASLIDGTNAWTTGGGIPVATNGAPTTDVSVLLTYRPDLIEGEVTGAITGLPSDISLNAWAMAFVLDQTDGTVLGLTTGPIYGSTLVPFVIPFLTADLDLTKTYVAGATVFDDVRTFRSPAGVPVITNGAPYTNVVLPVILAGPTATPTPVATPTVAPTVAPTAAPVATASPTGSSGSGTGVDPIVIAGVLGLAIVGLIIVIAVIRR